ncbi:hypothetical protein [Streptomyces sp. NPDC018045]|uniref:hypothetical protein n=1 Tax=Streptomyces sp. NPDC018045 TaxID=3365037 RepID=UPI0037B31357
MSDETTVDPMAEAGKRWAADVAARAGAVFPVFHVKVMAGATRTAFDFFFQRPSEFAAARVLMTLIEGGHEVVVKEHADNWIRVSLSVTNDLLTQWEKSEGTDE